MATIKYRGFCGSSTLTVFVRSIDDNGLGLDFTDHTFKSNPANPLNPALQHTIVNGFASNVYGLYERDETGAHPDNTYYYQFEDISGNIYADNGILEVESGVEVTLRSRALASTALATTTWTSTRASQLDKMTNIETQANKIVAGGAIENGGRLQTVDTLTALYLDQKVSRSALATVCTEVRMAELDAANLPADVDTLKDRLTAERGGYLDHLAGGNVALATTCSETRLAQLDEANIPGDIDDLNASMPALTRYGSDGTPLTADGTEQLVKEVTPSAVMVAYRGMIDLSNMVTGDTVIIKEYYKIKSGGSYRLIDSHTYSDSQSSYPVIDLTLKMPNRYGLKVTIQQTTLGVGGYKTFDWEFFTGE